MPTRREFLQTSGVIAAGTVLAGAVVPKVHAAENNTIPVALVGCGGRGTGAAFNALSTEGPTKLVALADVFQHRLDSAAKQLESGFKDKFDCPKERQFLGLDAFKHAVDAVGPGGLVLLATAPCFRPIHLEYAVEKGVNVFMEKSFAVDAPGIKRVLAAGKKGGEKNLKIAGGLMSRHSLPLREAVKKIHDGIIGNVTTVWAYREHGSVGCGPRPEGMSPLHHQIANYSCFTWVNGSFLLDWLIHNLDVACWVKDAWPVSAQGQGGRQVRKDKDQLFDHYAVEYTFPDGTKLFAQARHQNNTWDAFQDVVFGTTGSARLGEGVPTPEIFNGYQMTAQNRVWEGKDHNDQYQYEHDLLFDAIRNDKPYNETERCAYAAMTGILGRMASESGKMITWDEALNSTKELAPGLDKLDWNGDAPVMPDAAGNYTIAMPGETDVFK